MVSIIDDWTDIEIPGPPELDENIKLNAETAALLVLDLQLQNCNRERRPRCVRSLPKVTSLLKKSRNAGALVIYSLTSKARKVDIRDEVLPIGNEPIVRSGVDKFRGTELERILSCRGIGVLVIVGTSSHGAVLNTSTGAALRGYKVVIPVDCISSTEPYSEQYTLWHLVNAPGTRGRVRLSTSDGISFNGIKE